MSMGTDAETTIAVSPGAALAARPRLFAALAAAFPVRFVPWIEGAPDVAGVIAVSADPAVEPAPADRLPVLVVGEASPEGAPFEPVQLSESAALDRRLRGVVLRDRPAGASPAGGGEVLAATRAAAVWTRAGEWEPLHRVRSALPELAEDEVLYALLSRRAIAAVALVSFLRAVCGERGWRPPPLRAAFVFDDPNIRWRSYGHIDYRRLIEHADAHGYHVAMAMIPLDAARAHRPTAALFARRSDRLSLVFHGNDHVRHELLAVDDDRMALALAAQAVRRVQRFERRSGVRVERVMMPPHGLCSEQTARALSAVGFDALCAIHPAPWTEERPSSPPLVAWRPAEFVGGCAVIPRDGFSSTVADIALRAFLDHPLVIYGHHEDVAGGLDVLADGARRVNRMGDVRWTSAGGIALSNYEHRILGERVHVRAYSRRVRVDVPEGARELVVDEPQATGTALELAGWSVGDGPVLPFGEAARVAAGAREVRLRGELEVDPATVPAPAWRPWPRVRRAATELRDRALPLRHATGR